MKPSSDTCAIIILGATGDLSKRKLFPAIARLIQDKHLKKWAVIGAGLEEAEPAEILNKARPFARQSTDDSWQKLEQSFSYLALNFENEDEFSALKQLVESQETARGLSGNRLFFLATMPEHFTSITRALSSHGIVRRANQDNTQCGSTNCPWERVIYEKPFGRDLQTAAHINHEIAQAFDERQAFRIDHYLGKELVSNIALLRFANLFLQPLWNHEHIESVQVTLKETLGVEQRGGFYDSYGALRDVVQNHMLQLVSLVAMERPSQLNGEAIRDAKVKVLRSLRVESALLGQYEGYRRESAVNPNSTRETFAALRLSIDNDRWRGVPFLIKTGKALNEKTTRIHLTFKQPPPLEIPGANPVMPNRLTINIEPDEGFVMTLNGKKPGYDFATTPVDLRFCHKTLFGPNTPEAYEVLLVDALRGDQSVFVRFDEIEYSWKVIDRLLTQRHPLHSYTVGSKGPEELNQWACEQKISLLD